MTPNTLTVAVNGQDYQIGRFTARQGSWILAQLLTKMLPSMIETALAQSARGQLSSNRAQLSEDEFANLQALCLSVCRRLENGVPMPIFVLPSTWAVKELEYDLVTVVALTIHALKHNITPFFQGDGLSQLTALLPALGLGQS
jgi:hypothetical protein